MGRPKLPDYETFWQAGIDPKTGLPVKLVAGQKCTLVDDIRKQLRVVDRADAVNRFQ